MRLEGVQAATSADKRSQLAQHLLKTQNQQSEFLQKQNLTAIHILANLDATPNQNYRQQHAHLVPALLEFVTPTSDTASSRTDDELAAAAALYLAVLARSATVRNSIRTSGKLVALHALVAEQPRGDLSRYVDGLLREGDGRFKEGLDLGQLDQASARLQARVRGRTERRAVSQARAERNEAALTAQRVYRGHAARSHSRSLMAERVSVAVKIQAFVRAVRARRFLVHRKILAGELSLSELEGLPAGALESIGDVDDSSELED